MGSRMHTTNVRQLSRACGDLKVARWSPAVILLH